MQLLMDFAEQWSSSVLKWIEVFRQQDIVLDPVLLLLLAGVITLWLGSACWSSSIAEARGYGAKLHFFIGLLLPIVYSPIVLIGLNVKKSGRAEKKSTGKTAKKTQVQAQAQEVPPAHDPASPASSPEQTEMPRTPDEKQKTTDEENIPDAPDLILPEDTPAKVEVARSGPELHPLRKTPDQLEEPAAGEDANNQQLEFNQSAFRKMAEQTEDTGARFRIRYAGGRVVTTLEIVEATAQYAVVSVETDEGSSQRVRIPYARVEAVEPAE